MHRPPRAQFGVRLDPHVLDALKRAADDRGTTPAALARDAIVSALAICPSCGHDHTRPLSKQRNRAA